MQLRDRLAYMATTGLSLAALGMPLDHIGMNGNSVYVYKEDMRYAKTVLVIDPRSGLQKEVLRGPLVYEALNCNTVCDSGRQNAIYALFISPAPTIFAYGAGGSGSTGPTDPSRLRLDSELIAGTNRIGLTDSGGGSPFVTSDVISSITGSTRWVLVLNYTYPATDPNDGSTFNEFGIFDTAACPGSPTGTSGRMLMRFVPTTGTTKLTGFKLGVSWSFRA